MSNLPLDESGFPIPALSFIPNKAQKVTIGAATARCANPLAGGSEDKVHRGRIVNIYADADCYLNVGDENVEATATDHFFPAGQYYAIALKTNQTHIAAIQVTSGGTLYISELD